MSSMPPSLTALIAFLLCTTVFGLFNDRSFAETCMCLEAGSGECAEHDIALQGTVVGNSSCIDDTGEEYNIYTFGILDIIRDDLGLKESLGLPDANGSLSIFDPSVLLNTTVKIPASGDCGVELTVWDEYVLFARVESEAAGAPVPSSGQAGASATAAAGSCSAELAAAPMALGDDRVLLLDRCQTNATSPLPECQLSVLVAYHAPDSLISCTVEQTLATRAWDACSVLDSRLPAQDGDEYTLLVVLVTGVAATAAAVGAMLAWSKRTSISEKLRSSLI